MADRHKKIPPMEEEEVVLDMMENLSDIGDAEDFAQFEDDGWRFSDKLLEADEEAAADGLAEQTTDKVLKDVTNKQKMSNRVHSKPAKSNQLLKKGTRSNLAGVQPQIKKRISEETVSVVAVVEDLDVPVANEVTANSSNFCEINDLTKKVDIKWRKNITYLTPEFTWYEQQLPEVVKLESPLHFFSQYFTETFFEMMVENTNLYAVQQCTRFQPTNIEELKIFMGIHIIMGNTHYPRIKNYWEPRLKVSLIANNMPINRFYKLRQNVHFVNNEEKRDSSDRFWKVRPIYDVIRAKCLSLPLESHFSIDEQMVPFKGKLNVKQYVKGKPCPWGIKIFALCGSSGLLYDFILYQGATTELDKDCYKSMGLGAGVVATLAKRINVDNCQLYYDNYFSNYNLLQYLRRRNIWASGTARIDRFKSPPFSTDKILQKKGRGTSEEVISADGEVIMTKWFDNKPIIMASNYMGIGNQDSCKRWDKKQKQYIHISRPEVIKSYNMHMGGVDKMDFLITIYRSFIRSKKWTLRMFTHAIDMVCVNCWLEYKQMAITLGVEKKEILDLLHFRAYVAEALIVSKPKIRKRGRPTSLNEEEYISNRKRCNRRDVRPIEDVRYDRMDHFPQFDDKEYGTRCKLANCKGKSRTMCSKCNVHLCYTKQNNCFLKYHNK